MKIMGISRIISARKARAQALRDQIEARSVPVSCRMNGHVYEKYKTGWRCATCGNHISGVEGESYGLSEDGHLERRRERR